MKTRLEQFQYKMTCAKSHFHCGFKQLQEALDIIWWGITSFASAFKFEKPKQYKPWTDAEWAAYDDLASDKLFDKLIMEAINATVKTETKS